MHHDRASFCSCTPIVRQDGEALGENRVERVARSSATAPSLLAGLVYDEAGERMSPTHAHKKGTRYRYYVSQSLIKRGRPKAWAAACRVPAAELETRIFVTAIGDGRVRGALLRMGNSIRDIDIKVGRQRDQRSYARFQADQEVALGFRHPTDLKAMPEPLFDCIARHGYEIADATLTAHVPGEFARSFAWS